MTERAALLAAMKGRRIAVLGDLIADCYVETHPERLSREAPVLFQTSDWIFFGRLLAVFAIAGTPPIRQNPSSASARLP